MARKKLVQPPCDTEKEQTKDNDVRKTVQKLEQCPPEVIRMVLQYLQQQPSTLKVLKYAGPTIRNQINPILHRGIIFPLERDFEKKITDFRNMPFLESVRNLWLYDLRDCSLYPPRLQYFLALDAISMLHNLRNMIVTFPAQYDEALISFLDVLSSLPLLQHLEVSRSGQADLPEPAVLTMRYVQEDQEEISSFPSLKLLVISRLAPNPQDWLLSQFRSLGLKQHRVSSLKSLRIDAHHSSLTDVLALIASQSATLELLSIEGR